MDQISICTPGLLLRPGLESNFPPLLREAFEATGGFQLNRNEQNRSEWSSIRIGPEKATQINIRKFDGVWQIRRVRVCLPHWIWGHNGWVISNQDDFLNSLQRYWITARPFVRPGEENHLLPGLDENSPTYWESIEVPFHIPDEHGRLLEAFKNVRHPRVHSEPTISEHSVTLSGHLFTLRIYDKAEQMRASNSRSGNFLRCECKFTKAGIEDYIFGFKAKSPEEICKRGGKTERFSLGTARKAALSVFAELEGVFLEDIQDAEISTVPKLLAAIARTERIPLHRLNSIMRGCLQLTERTKKSHMKKAAKAFAAHEGIKISAFMEKALSSPVALGAGSAMTLGPPHHSLPIDQNIRETYYDSLSDTSIHWKPSTSIQFSWPSDLELFLSGDDEALFRMDEPDGPTWK